MQSHKCIVFEMHDLACVGCQRAEHKSHLDIFFTQMDTVINNTIQ